MSRLLLDEHPLQVMPKLATLIGLNEAIVIQQVHYWLKHKQDAGQDFIDGHYWVYNTYEQWQEQFPFWSVRTLKRIFTSLEKSGLLLTANYNKAGFDKTKWYSINYNVLNNLDSTSCQSGTIVVPTCHHGVCQNDTTNTIDYTEITPKTSFNVLNGAVSETNTTQSSSWKPFDSSILKKQIIKACHKQGIDDCSDFLEIITYYYEAYMRTFHKEHPRLSSNAMESVISALYHGSEMVDEFHPETYEAMIEQYFQTQYNNCDYNICHFMTEGIRNNRFYEACY